MSGPIPLGPGLNKLSRRILARLSGMERREVEVWMREDYHLAWLTVLYAARGHADPSGFAFWMMYGITRKKYLALRYASASATTACADGTAKDRDALESPVIPSQRKPPRSERKYERARAASA